MKDLQPKLLKLIGALKRYVLIICIVIYGAMYAYLIYLSGQQASRQPSESQINEKYQKTTRPKINSEVARQLIELQDQNIEVKSLFEEARKNPFSE